MDKKILKSWLLEKKTGVYTVLVETYSDQVKTLKPSLFIDWIAHELNIKTSDISQTGIRSAIKRYKKDTPKNTGQKIQNAMKESAGKIEGKKDFNTEIPDVFPGFK